MAVAPKFQIAITGPILKNKIFLEKRQSRNPIRHVLLHLSSFKVNNLLTLKLTMRDKPDLIDTNRNKCSSTCPL